MGLFKKILIISFVGALFIALQPQILNAEELFDTGDKTKHQLQVSAFLGASGINTSATVGGITAKIITTVLSLLGIIFVILMIYAGYLWMMAQGNEDQVSKAKGIITTAIIGLIIIVAAYSITYFVFKALGNASTGGSMM